jgi:transcriptional regulator of heat shock response
MNSRTKLILKKSIEDFINTGRPITSNYLFEKYDFGIRPAMIRRELNNLDNNGFLFQVHSSGGRVPTNKGYRFFVKDIQSRDLEFDISERKTRQIIERLVAKKMEVFAEILADYLNTLNAVYQLKQNEFYASGLEDLFSSVEIETKSELGQIIRDFEMLPKRLSEIVDKIEIQEKPQVYIGRNPITRSSYLSVVSERFVYGDDEFILLTVSPRRMDYRKLLCLYRLIEEEITNL